MSASVDTSQKLDYRLAISNHIDWAVKVDLWVVISEEYQLRDMGMTCYFVTGIYGANLWFAIALKTLMDWEEDNRGYILHPTLQTTPIPTFYPPVLPSHLCPTWLHIAPQLLVLQFPLH